MDKQRLGDTTAPATTSDEAVERYEPPRIEDLETSDGPSVTAAGTQTRFAAPRDL